MNIPALNVVHQVDPASDQARAFNRKRAAAIKKEQKNIPAIIYQASSSSIAAAACTIVPASADDEHYFLHGPAGRDLGEAAAGPGQGLR